MVEIGAISNFGQKGVALRLKFQMPITLRGLRLLTRFKRCSSQHGEIYHRAKFGGKRINFKFWQKGRGTSSQISDAHNFQRIWSFNQISTAFVSAGRHLSSCQVWWQTDQFQILPKKGVALCLEFQSAITLTRFLRFKKFQRQSMFLTQMYHLS